MRRWDYPARERGAGDCDQPYRFGQVITSDRPGPFSLRELARLLLLKVRVRDAAEAPANVAAVEAPLD